MSQKAVLAFSGGLDTSVVVKYLQDMDMDVVTVTVDVGQQDNYNTIERKAKRLGVKKHYTIDAKREFVTKYVHRAIMANALYQKKYCLATALARPLIASKVLHVAKKEKVTTLAHGCSGKGNDQVRFDATMMSMGLPIIAPIRDLNLDRPTEIEFAKQHHIPIDRVAKRFSIDQNLWGRAIEGGVLEDPFVEPPNSAFTWVKTQNLPQRPTYVEITFRRGIPVSLDGKRYDPVELVSLLNDKAGAAGVGIVDHIEDRTVGIKSREVYETPAAVCLVEAHADLEKMVHTKHQNRFKDVVDEQWAWLAYSGLWDDPLRADLDAHIEHSQKAVNGTVRLKLFGGSMRVVGRKSKNSLYRRDIATYGSDSEFDQRLANGFVRLWTQQTTEANKLQR